MSKNLFTMAGNDVTEAPKNSSEHKACGFTFFSGFDSGNLARVEEVTLPPSATPTPAAVPEPDTQADQPQEPVAAASPPPAGQPDYHFSMWTRPDCAGTEFENGNRTWFYFGIKDGPEPGKSYNLQFTFRSANRKLKIPNNSSIK